MSRSATPLSPHPFVLGWISSDFALLFFALALLAGLLFSFGALRIEERAFQRYGRWRCLGRLMLAAVVENFGYRQLITYVRAKAFWTLGRKGSHWGHISRIGYTIEPPAELALSEELAEDLRRAAAEAEEPATTAPRPAGISKGGERR